MSLSTGCELIAQEATHAGYRFVSRLAGFGLRLGRYVDGVCGFVEWLCGIKP